jgi:hypothetical protein
MKPENIDLVLPDNTNGWKQGWFYLDNPAPALPDRTGRAPIPFPEWINQLTSRVMEDLCPLLDDLERLKAEGLTSGAVAISFSLQLIQPIQDRVHSAFEYWGQSDPTRAAKHKVSKGEMAVRVKNIFNGCIRNRECPKVLGVYRPSDAVSFRSQFPSSLELKPL